MTRQYTISQAIKPTPWPCAKPKEVLEGVAQRWNILSKRLMTFRFGIGKKHSTRRDVTESLRDFTSRFREHHSRTDAQFVELGRILRNLYTTAESLGKVVGAQLTSMRDALGASRIGGADGLAAAALQDVQAALGKTAGDLGMLRSVTEDLRRFRAQVDGTHRIGRFVELSVLLFTIESARTVECRDLFGAFIAELRGLGQKIVGVTDAIGASAAETQTLQEIECQSIAVSHDALRDLVKDLETAAHLTSGEAQQLLDASLSAFNEAGNHMTALTKHAGEAIFYLQFGDIIRQKTEHITDALLEAAARLSENVSEGEFRNRVGDIDRILAIQAGQLNLIRREIADAADKLAGAFAQLGNDAHALRSTLDRCQARDETKAKTGHAVDQLKADVSRMETLYRQGNTLQLEAQQIAQRVRTASRQLVEHVEQVKAINRDIHLQALNAIIKAVALGSQGTTLSVLSMHADWLYRESNTLVKELVETLGNILAITENGGDQSASTDSQTLNLRTATDRIAAAYETCDSTGTQVGKLIDTQHTTLTAANVAVGAINEHLPAIDEQIQHLAAIRKTLIPWLDSDTRRESDAASLQQLYTMNSERAVHAAVAEKEPALAQSNSVNMQGASGIPDKKPGTETISGDKPKEGLATVPNDTGLGDNVELF